MKALITGASSGMGRDMAKILSQNGYDLILVARDEKRLEEVKKQLKTETKIVVMDISKEENCKKIYEENKDIDILINNAGFGDCGHFEETSLDKDIQMIHTNIIAYHILTKLYLKEMIKKDSGKILNVASIAGFMPGPLMTTYYSTKNAINKFFKGKFYIVPGWKIKLARIGAKLAPASLVAKISYNMQKRKIR